MPNERETHYVPAFANWGPGLTQAAVCGRFVDPFHDHNAEPTCVRCRELLERDDRRLDQKG